MSAPRYELVPLDCPSCGASLAAAEEDVVFYCTACRNGYRYRSAVPPLVPVDVGFVAAPNQAVEKYLPFWLLEASVEIGGAPRRQMPSLIRSFLGSGGEPRSGPGRFVVPAFQADLDAAIELVRRYTREFPKLDELLGERLVGGCFGVEDARKFAHFAVIAGEVDKGGVLRSLDYSIEFGAARLLGVPFARAGDSWKDSLFGIRI